MSKEPQQQMMIQDENDLDDKLRKLMLNDSTVYMAYRTGELLGMSKTKLYANIVLLLAVEKAAYFNMALKSKSMEMPTPLNLKDKQLWTNQPNPHSREQQLIEQLAAIEHGRWASWQNYLHTFLTWNNELHAWVLPHEKKDQWQSLTRTPYSMLSEAEKQSDRDQVARYWPLIEAYTAQQSLLRAKEELEKLVKSCTYCEGKGYIEVYENGDKYADKEIEPCEDCGHIGEAIKRLDAEGAGQE
jgi:hypothetical protein